ncbi:hypothetical protein AABB24_003146 [Solanum stoloniferum]|uniref:Small ribosomal subunit protein mS38 n=2 Tax=Solanum TaxID=4107 RepID=A0AAF0TDS1_SOLVR|nr:uncharacterized protein LOC125836255 [Solanum verrucosum]WMV15216.1 hypothetical protein MTR67_008601 [Solanum verrucosum]
MASILRKSLQNKFLSAARITTILSSKPIPTSPLFHHPSSSGLGQIPFFLQGGTSDSKLNVGFYPSFSFGHFLNPVSPNGFISPVEDIVVDDDSRKIWADSVKKKRKKKMNKHKLKKLRKRLRRKTKT